MLRIGQLDVAYVLGKSYASGRPGVRRLWRAIHSRMPPTKRVAKGGESREVDFLREWGASPIAERIRLETGSYVQSCEFS